MKTKTITLHPVDGKTLCFGGMWLLYYKNTHKDKKNQRSNRINKPSELSLPVFVLHQQLVEFLCLCTAVQVVSLLQNLP